jgi:hypothetical protein
VGLVAVQLQIDEVEPPGAVKYAQYIGGCEQAVPFAGREQTW